MRLLTLFISSIILVGICQAQETERKVVRAKNGDKEEFYVLKSDNNIRHGEYEKKGYFSHVIGTYKNGMRDGLWTEYSNGSKLRSKGTYANNERIGVWKFYSWEGELEQEYDFTTRELLSDHLLEGMKTRRFKVVKGTDTIV
jgi:antitoxin component YwqK of YwqJK toxin-antitoxin module